MEAAESELAARQIAFARQYTLRLLQDIDDELWFVRPAACPSHIAWQVGHLAMAQYALTLLRIRGKEPEDAELISKDFFRQFMKGTAPSDASDRPPWSADEIRQVFHNVHERCLLTLPGYTSQLLEEPLTAPYAVYPNKLGSLLFCSAHEMLHAGQIGLIRRQLGKPPLP
jgi:hypothetical protein